MRVAAVPSATVTVSDGADPVGRFRWGDLSADGDALDRDGVRVEVDRERSQLGPRDGARRGDRQARAVPRPLPIAGRRSVPAARPPRPRELGPRHVAHRRRGGPPTRPHHVRVHRRDLPGMAPAEATSSSTSPAASSTSRSARSSTSSRAGGSSTLRLRRWASHERGGLVLGRLARPLPVGAGVAPRAARRGPERREPPPEPVGEPVHQHGGLHRRSRRGVGRSVRHVGEPGEPAAVLRSHGALGSAAAGDAVVHRRPDRGRAGLVAGDDPEPLGRRRP